MAAVGHQGPAAQRLTYPAQCPGERTWQANFSEQAPLPTSRLVCKTMTRVGVWPRAMVGERRPENQLSSRRRSLIVVQSTHNHTMPHLWNSCAQTHT